VTQVPNPLPYMTGQKLGEFLRQNKYAKPNVKNGPPIIISGGKGKLVEKIIARQRHGGPAD